MVLLAAEEWGVPPWIVMEQMTGYWWKRWVLFYNERAKKRK